MMRLSLCAYLLLAALALVAACAAEGPEGSAPPPAVAPSPEPQQKQPAPAAEATPDCPEKPGLCLLVTPPEAELLVDGDSRGPLSPSTANSSVFLALPSGIYQITLRSPGYLTWRAEVSVRDRGEMIEVTLRQEEKTDL